MKVLNQIYLLLFLVLYACSSDETPEVVNNNPITVSIEDFTLNIDENPENGAILGQIIASTNSGTLNYKLGINDQEPYFAMDLDFDTGILTVQDSTAFNFENHPIIIATAFAMNGDVQETSQITINVNDVYEKYSYIGNIELNSQQEVDDFGQENHWGVSGILSINNTQGDITDLSPLESIINVGSLFIKSLEITNLIGFNNIQDVENSTRIINNPFLQNLEGLSNNFTTGKDIEIHGNSSLINLSGFPNIDLIVNDLVIRENHNLISLEGFSNINTIGGDLYIKRNNQLNDLTSLISLNEIGENISINQNDLLSSLSGLENITHVGGNLNISSQIFITEINVLSNIQNIFGDLNIINNPQLLNFCGIENLIINNGLEGDYLIEDNAYNPTQQDIIDGNCSN